MKSVRNKSIDILRTIALLVVIIYHIYAVSGMQYSIDIINKLISMGGELGVSIFFVISGYSIYQNLSHKNYNSYGMYLINRIKRISPHYYISIFFILILTNSAVYLSKEHFLNIVSHLFFFHNLFYNCHGAISGVLWTMGVIFQFYLIAPFIKKCIDKKPILSVIISIVITIIFKYVLFYVFFSKQQLNEMYYFIYGRQLFTTIDAFVLGMFISKIESKQDSKNYIYLSICLIFIVILLLCGSNYFTFFGNESIHSASFKGIFFFIILDVIISLVIYFLSSIKIPNNKITQILLSISKHEYAIYIWHLLILNSLIAYSGLYTGLKHISQTLTFLVLTSIVIILGIVIDLVISNINFQKIYENFITFIKNNKKSF